MTSRASGSISATQDASVRVSAIVVARRRTPPLDMCLKGVLADPWVDELIIVNAGVDAEAASNLRALKADRRDVVLIHASRGLGLAASRNLAASAAKGRWLLFVEPNIVLQRGAVGHLIAAGRVAPSPWVAGGRLIDPKGKDRADAMMEMPTMGGALAEAFGLPSGRKPIISAKPMNVEAVGRALLLTPKSDFSRLGGFADAALEPAETLDLCRRATGAGGVVRFAPKAEALAFAALAAGAEGAGKEAKGLSLFLARAAETWPQRALVWAFGPLLRGVMTLRGLLTDLLDRR